MLLHGRRVRLLQWLESREVAHEEEEVLEVEANSASSSTAQLLLGRARHAHPRSHRENKRVVKKGVEVEIPAIRFMLEFRTPASASG
jgi:hypothetical protein